jgi:hypothetical protein
MKKLCLCLSVNSAVAIVFVLFQVNSAFGQSTEKPVYLTPAQSIEVMFRRVETVLIKTAEAMPADKYPFAPTTGEFKGVRTFGPLILYWPQQLWAKNHPLKPGMKQGPTPCGQRQKLLTT